MEWKSISEEFARLLPAELARDERLFPIGETEGRLTVLTDKDVSDPLLRDEAERQLEFIVGQPIQLVLAADCPELEFSLGELLDKHYGKAIEQVVSLPVAQALSTVLVLAQDAALVQRAKGRFCPMGLEVASAETLDHAIQLAESYRTRLRLIVVEKELYEMLGAELDILRETSGASLRDSDILHEIEDDQLDPQLFALGDGIRGLA